MEEAAVDITPEMMAPFHDMMDKDDELVSTFEVLAPDGRPASVVVVAVGIMESDLLLKAVEALLFLDKVRMAAYEQKEGQGWGLVEAFAAVEQANYGWPSSEPGSPHDKV